MTDDLRPLPPPTHPVTSPSAGSSGRLRHPAALFALASGLGIGAAIIVGLGAGTLVMESSSSNCSSSDGWCELGAAILGVLIGVAIGAIAYVIVGVMTVVRHRPAGHRSALVIALLTLPVALLVASAVLGAIVP